MNLSFYGALNEEQRQLAELIAQRARALGVPPELAVSVAFKESGLNPNVGRGSAGEVGIMQVKPTTGKDMGFTFEDLQTPERNIDAGLKYLKRSLDASEGNQKLAVVGYNAGINHPFFSGGDLPSSTKKYVQDITEFGGFSGELSKQEATPPAAQVAAAPQMDELEQRLLQAKNEQERRMAQIGGAGAGAGLVAARAAGDTASAATSALGRQFRAAAGQPPVTPPPPSGVMPTQDQITRIMQGTTEDGVTGRARSTGFNAQTAQEAARVKEAERLIGGLQRSGVVSQSAPQVFANAPGGTSTPSGVWVPRSVNVPPTTAPPKPSGLDQITQVFRSMADPASRVLGTAMRYAAPPLSLGFAGGEAARAYQDVTSPEPDYTGAALSGLGALGGVLSTFPATMPVGLPLATGAPLARDIVSKVRAQQEYNRLNPPAPPTPEEEAEAAKPAFGLYPMIGRRRPTKGLPGASGQ
jgi:hypothetical protein